MEIAKESFLARLQREREESKTSVKPVPITEAPKVEIKFNSGPVGKQDSQDNDAGY